MNKQQILEAVQRMPDDVSIDHVIESLDVLRRIELGLQQADAGDLVSHEEVKARFLRIKAAAG